MDKEMDQDMENQGKYLGTKGNYVTTVRNSED